MKLGPPAMVRFQIPVPDKLNFFPYQLPAVSPDGQRIAFTASATNSDDRLFVRPLNAATATEIPIPGSAGFPFWSPDGQQIAFSLRRNPPESGSFGGPPVTICDCRT